MQFNRGNDALWCHAETVVKRLQQDGHTAYFVGGVVRDSLLGKPVKDIDIVTSALPEQVSALFERNHPIGAAFGIITVVEGDIPYEVATFREERDYMDGRHPETVCYTDDPKVDALRRDFTINGMFYDPVTDRVFDFVGGVDDLSRGVLRTIGDPMERFREDYLRMFRAVRFANRFGFQLDDAIPPVVNTLKDRAGVLSAERIREELNKMLVGPAPSAALRMLHELGLLEVILPEITAMDGVTQPEKFHPEGDVLEHTLLMLDHMSWPSVELAWSILLHDVGKPEAYTVDDDGIEHFYGHEAHSDVMARDIMDRLRFPRKTIDVVCHAVRNHMRFAHVTRMRVAKLKRLLAEPDFLLELELHRIDCIGCHGKLDNYLYLVDELGREETVQELPQPLVTGRDLLAAGMQPGPEMGKLLKEVADHQLEQPGWTRDEALVYVKERLAGRTTTA